MRACTGRMSALLGEGSIRPRVFHLVQDLPAVDPAAVITEKTEFSGSPRSLTVSNFCYSSSWLLINLS